MTNEKECTTGINYSSTVPVKGSSKRALVDRKHRVKFNKMTWHLHKKGYVKGWNSETKSQVYMHHMVLPARPGFVVDHINDDRLDNRRKNLRYISNLENITRAKCMRPGAYKGVHLIKGKWFAHITKDKKLISLGKYSSARDAAIAYDAAAQVLFGNLSYRNI